jgi:hypothetical protein
MKTANKHTTRKHRRLTTMTDHKAYVIVDGLLWHIEEEKPKQRKNK